ncbi:MAG: cytochrome P450, partial [uncultured Gemmatimonadetes bacterium]
EPVASPRFREPRAPSRSARAGEAPLAAAPAGVSPRPAGRLPADERPLGRRGDVPPGQPPRVPADAPGPGARRPGHASPQLHQEPGAAACPRAAGQRPADQRGRVPPAPAEAGTARVPQGKDRGHGRRHGAPRRPHRPVVAPGDGAGRGTRDDADGAGHCRRHADGRRRGRRGRGDQPLADGLAGPLRPASQPVRAPAGPAARARHPADEARAPPAGRHHLSRHRPAPPLRRRPRRPAGASAGGPRRGRRRRRHDGPSASRRVADAVPGGPRDHGQRAGVDLAPAGAEPRRRGAPARRAAHRPRRPRARRGGLPGAALHAGGAGGIHAPVSAGVDHRAGAAGGLRGAGLPHPRREHRAGEPLAGAPRRALVERAPRVPPRALAGRRRGVAPALRVLPVRRRAAQVHRRGVRVDGGRARPGHPGRALAPAPGSRRGAHPPAPHHPPRHRRADARGGSV